MVESAAPGDIAAASKAVRRGKPAVPAAQLESVCARLLARTRLDLLGPRPGRVRLAPG